ncbi:MAG: NAD-dependent epimerase/dehydratase family protein [Planctomycetaceae bacterium]|nr:NAD-dependent epimerase/dehydratase family protein [Planctomycetaceae bacterium]
MSEILITGGAGFIGSHLTELLLTHNHTVTIVDDLSTGTPANLKHLEDHSGLIFIHGDIGNEELLHEVIQNKDQVYHLAAAVGVALIAKQPIETIERNIYPTQLLLAALRQRIEAGETVTTFFSSTSEVYGKNPKETWTEEDDLVFGATTRPRWSYGVSKAIDEFLALACVKEYNLPIVIGRFFNVVGPRQTGTYGMVLPRFVQAALAGEPLQVHDDGKQIRCFSHVYDVTQAITKLMETQDAFGKVINIGSDNPISILDLAKRVIEICGSTSNIEFQTYTEAYDESFEDIRRRVPDLTRIRNMIGDPNKHDIDQIINDVRDSLT